MQEQSRQRARRKKKRLAADEIRTSSKSPHGIGIFFLSGSRNTIKGGLYENYRHLVITRKFLAPEKLAGKPIEVTFLSDAKLNRGAPELFPIRSAGHLTLPRSAYAICHLPMDALPSVLQMLAA